MTEPVYDVRLHNEADEPVRCQDCGGEQFRMSNDIQPGELVFVCRCGAWYRAEIIDAKVVEEE